MFGFLKNKKKDEMIRVYEDADDTEYYEDQVQHRSNLPWYGVDLDGTLATSEGLENLETVGKPVPLMMERVKLWIAQGHKVKIMTARASDPNQIPIVKKWLKKHNLPDLDVTNQKDYDMVELWDDRCIQVLPDTGRPVLKPSAFGAPSAPLLKEELKNKTFVLEEK